MTILVLGATGTVGSQVTRELLARGQQVRVLTRDAKKAAALGKVEITTGDLREPATVRSCFTGVDAVFLLNPVSQTETHEALLAVSGMMAAGVKRVVYLSVYHCDAAPYIPHFGSKVSVEAAVAKSGMAWTVLRANNFYQNDYWFQKPLIESGVYPQSLGNVGLSRVDVRDIADAAAVALIDSGHDGQIYDLVGPKLETGLSTAATWARALGRAVAYAGDDLDAWEQQSLLYTPAWMVYDFRIMYHHFQTRGLLGSAGDVERITKVMGHPPRSFEAFAAETARQWK